MGEVCSSRFAFILSTGLRKLSQNPVRLLAGLVEPGQTVADLGCGPGFFTTALAELVGPAGRVFAVDVQPQMLSLTQKRADKVGVTGSVRTHLCEEDRIGLTEPLDFALAFYVVHEVPDAEAFLAEVFESLKPGGRLLIVEPKIHVSSKSFEATLQCAAGRGFQTVGEPSVFFSRSALLERPVS